MKKRNNEWIKYKEVLLIFIIIIVSIGVLSFITKWNTKEQWEKGLCINEICEKSYGYSQMTGAYCGYVELYNPTSNEISLERYYITNDKKKRENRAYLKGLSIGPKEHLVLVADGTTYIEGENHIPILLREQDETVYLLNNGGVILDYVQVPKLENNLSYYRKTDGSSIWQVGESTPEICNDNSDYTEPLKEPVFSLPSGFYQSGTFLELEKEKLDAMEEADVQIVYTIDGSLPGMENGNVYSEAIDLEKLSHRKNMYANRQDVSAGFFEEEIKKVGQNIPEYGIPDDDLDKAVVIRAALVNKHSGSVSKTVTQTYFIDYQGKSAYDQLSTVSLVTDPGNLFDSKKGIYVLGDFWDKTGPNDEPWEFWHANYTQNGPSWERPAQIEYFDENKVLQWTQNIGISIRGYSSRAYSQKGFQLHAREELDGNQYIDYPFFYEEDELQTLQLTNAGNDTDTKLKDYLMSQLIPDRNFSNPLMIPCNVFLNGEYWGMYYVAQNYDKQYIQNYYGVEKDNVIIINSNFPHQ